MCVSIDELRRSVADYAAGFDAALLSSAHAERVVDEASSIERIASTVKALAAARVAETGGWRAEGDRSPAHHLARRTGTTVVQAASAIDTARRLETLPETSAAARRGELSAEAASAIAAAAGVDPRAEHALLETARRVPLAELRERCARTVAAAQADPEARRARIHQRRSLRSYTDTEGEWHLHCRNNPEVGAAIMAALEPFREAIFRHARSEARHEPPEAYAADALTEMARCSAGAEVECSEARGTAPEAGGKEAGATEAGGTKSRGHGGRCHEGRWHEGRGHWRPVARRPVARRPVARRAGARRPSSPPGPSGPSGSLRMLAERRPAGPAGSLAGRERRAGLVRPRSSCGLTWRRCSGAGPPTGRCVRSPGSGRWRCRRCAT